MSEILQLENLIGLHELSGVDFETATADDEQANVINFVLDGMTYTAIEDPSDGYRSSMKEIKVSDFAVTNLFPAIQVLCVMRETKGSEKHDILDLFDVRNGKRVLSVGTDSNDSYYPSFVSDWLPGNMHLNSDVRDGDDIPF